MRGKWWNEKEIAYLKKYYPLKGKKWCCIKLERPDGGIRDKASELGLKQNRDTDFFKDWQKRAGESKIGKKRPDHSNFMKKLVRERKDLVFSVGRKRTKEEKEATSLRTKKWMKEKGHPRGMLGKHHTSEFKRITSERFKKMWEDKDNFVNSQEYRQIVSDRAKEQHKNGFLNQGYSRGKMGHYDINGKDIFFRSLWEANYAIYLDFLIKQGEIKKWDFEIDTFWFEKIKRGVRSYKPDFKVITKSGALEYHEVKGWMDKKSATKIKRMAKYYPKIKLIVIDEDSYKDIKKKLGKALKFYE